MAPQGYHTVRTHIRRNPGRGGKKLSGWMIAGLLAGVWSWGQVIGFGEATQPQPKHPAPKATYSAPAQR